MKQAWRRAAVCLPMFFLLAATAPAQGLGGAAEQWRFAWPKTDFRKYSVNLDEILSGGVPKDGIPPIDRPKFVSVSEAAKWVGPEEPVLVFGHRGDVRAYPLQILIWHEIVNDVVGGKPVVITFCPLCNSALVFDRKVKGRVLDFGTTGKLRHSDLVMWDRQTESWWQQLEGEAIVGTMTGARLTFLYSPLVSYRTFSQAHPKAKVLSRDTGVNRRYGGNPYVGYDSMKTPFLFRGPVDGRLKTMERVVALDLGGEVKAYPYGELEKVNTVNDRVGGTEVVIFYAKGTRSALDGGSIANSRDVGTAVVFQRNLNGRKLTFKKAGGHWVDLQTASRWNMIGQAVSGEMKGKQLRGVVYANHFAFAWLAFRPGTKIYKAP